MEALLSDFDYGLVDASGKMKIVSRNEATAFLTKHLRIYGGSGEYEDFKIGRVLRAFRFVGMGNVNDPANPTSIYTQIDATDSETHSFVTKEDLDTLLNRTLSKVSKDTREKTMFDTLEQAKARIEELEQEVSNMRDQSSKEAMDAVRAELDEIKASAESLSNELEAEKNKVEVAEQKLIEAAEQKTEMEQKIEGLEKDLTEKNDRLATIDADQSFEDRISKLSALNIDVTDDMKNRVRDMNDDTFVSMLEWVQEFAGAKTDPDETKQTKEPSDAEIVSDATKQAEADLEEAKENADSVDDVAEAAVEGDEEDSRKAVASVLAKCLINHKNSQ